MYPFLRKIPIFSSYIRTLESAFIPGLKKLKNVMSYLKRSNLGLDNEIRTIDYNHTPTGSYLYNDASKWLSYGHVSDVEARKSRGISVNCGELRISDRRLRVHMAGRIKFQRIKRFLNLNDSHGCTQLVLPDDTELSNRIQRLANDTQIEIVGTVRERPKGSYNKNTPTGEIEVYIEELLDFFAPKRKSEINDETTSQKPAKKKSKLTPKSLNHLELTKCATEASRRIFRLRTHTCSELSESHVGETVRLSGWLGQRRTDVFGTISDGYGEVQLVVKDCKREVSNTFKNLDIQDTLIWVKGVVKLRPSNQRNVGVGTNGEVEVKVTNLEEISLNATDTEDGEKDPEGDIGESAGGVNRYCNRTHTCGELRASDVDKEVVLYGWLESQRTHRFARIRDGYGATQLIMNKDEDIRKTLQYSPLESVIKVSGIVNLRPEDQIHHTEKTGEIEVLVKTFETLNPARTDLPFIVRDHNRPKENIRMKYRYLDLRFSDMQDNLRLRSQVLMRMREFLINRMGFVEVETPTLFRRTPGGAQEYVVPTRTEGKFYSLVQSPQQLKQLLMIGSMDRYFQVARCYRDEGARPDRQPEFTQMDIELSFTNKNQIMLLIEDLLKAGFPNDTFTIRTPFPVITYQEAMHWYGSDKPDISFEKKLIDISELIENKDLLPEYVTDVKSFTAKALIFETSHSDNDTLMKAIRDCEDQQKLKGDNKCKIITARCNSQWKEELEEFLPFVKAGKLKETIEFPIPCTIVVGVGEENEILPWMGKLRKEMFKKTTTGFHFAWIVDFPLFLEQDDGTLESAHHPFTQPHEQDISLLDSNPLKVRGLHFDLVLNGYEVGGGSIRIHDALLQSKVLKDILKIPTDSLQHLLEALTSGAPPHGGIALGIDRLMSVMMNTDSIRDVIAFPKGVDGKDPMSGAPCSISQEEKKLYHLIPRSPK